MTQIRLELGAVAGILKTLFVHNDVIFVQFYFNSFCLKTIDWSLDCLFRLRLAVSTVLLVAGQAAIPDEAFRAFVLRRLLTADRTLLV